MKKNPSLCAVASAGIIFLLFSLVAQLTLAHPGSGIFHSIGLILVTSFQLVFWIIGLVIGVALCIAVMLCIYVVFVYFVNRSQGAEVAARTKLLACTQVRRILTFVAPQYFGEFAGAEACCGSACASVMPPTQNAAIEITNTATVPFFIIFHQNGHYIFPCKSYCS